MNCVFGSQHIKIPTKLRGCICHGLHQIGSQLFWMEVLIFNAFGLFTTSIYHQTPPRDFDRLCSNLVSLFISHGWIKVIRSVSFCACWRGIARYQSLTSRHETQNCYIPYTKKLLRHQTFSNWSLFVFPLFIFPASVCHLLLWPQLTPGQLAHWLCSIVSHHYFPVFNSLWLCH